jgi:hypothetical protein
MPPSLPLDLGDHRDHDFAAVTAIARDMRDADLFASQGRRGADVGYLPGSAGLDDETAYIATHRAAYVAGNLPDMLTPTR